MRYVSCLWNRFIQDLEKINSAVTSTACTHLIINLVLSLNKKKNKTGMLFCV